MKVLLANNLYGANARGGAERVVAQEASALAALGDEVAVIALAAETSGAGVTQEHDGTARIVRLRSENIFHYLRLARHGYAARLAWHLIDMCGARAARAFMAIVAKEKPDAVHTHNLMGLGFLIPATLRRHGIRHVHTVHDVQLLHPSGLLPNGVLSPLARAYAFLMRVLLGSPDVVIFPSVFLRALHEAHGFFPRSQRLVLSNPAPAVSPIARIHPGARFFFAGQLEPHKGVRVLVDAWEKASLDGAELVIAGTGSLDAELKEAASRLRGVHLVGKLAPDQVHAEMLRAAWTVAPSTVIENAPAVIAESLSAGTPLIASVIGGIPEFIKEGTTGHLIRPGDADALAQALRHAEAGKEWEAMSNNCRQANENRSLETHATALRMLYVAE